MEPIIENKTSTSYFIKLFHPIEPAVPCKNQGLSDRFNLVVSDRNLLRGLIESEDHTHFNGDKCKKCGALAKVFITEEQIIENVPKRKAEG